MKKYIRIVALLLLISTLTLLLASCGGEKYTLGSLSFTLPEKMRKMTVAGYDMHFSTMECTLAIQQLDDEELEPLGVTLADGLEAIVDNFFIKNKMDKSQCFLSYSEEQGAYSFRYSVSSDEQVYYFHYVLIRSNGTEAYFVDMTCDFEKANYYLIEFQEWGKSFKLGK